MQENSRKLYLKSIKTQPKVFHYSFFSPNLWHRGIFPYFFLNSLFRQKKLRFEKLMRVITIFDISVFCILSHLISINIYAYYRLFFQCITFIIALIVWQISSYTLFHQLLEFRQIIKIYISW